MSIRYTLRHNIPAEKLAAEDVNDSSTWDLDLLRKHELAETDDYDVVYRQHDGRVVSWAEAATQQAQQILTSVQGISASIDEQVQTVESELEDVSAAAAVITQEAEEANYAAQQAVIQAEAAVESSSASATAAQTSSNLSRDWATKTDGKVDNEDYSSKYYAGQASTSATNAATSETNAGLSATAAATSATSAATSESNASNSAILAQDWASKTSGKVDGNEYSAKHYADIASQVVSGYLPLSGGTMTGAISGNMATFVLQNTYASNQGATLIRASSSEINTAYLQLNGNDSPITKGGFILGSTDGIQRYNLVGRRDGTLKWNDNPILTASNYNSYALPLSGGTMTGNIKTSYKYFSIQSSVSNSEGSITLFGGSANNNGAYLTLNGKGYTHNPGSFSLYAHDGTNSKQLQGKPDGTLTWNGKSIPQRSYGVNLGANTTHTFDIAENGAVIFAKRGDNASCHMVTVWDATSTQFFVSGTDPITVSVSVGAKTATITNVSASSVAVKIINGGAL